MCQLSIYCLSDHGTGSHKYFSLVSWHAALLFSRGWRKDHRGARAALVQVLQAPAEGGPQLPLALASPWGFLPHLGPAERVFSSTRALSTQGFSHVQLLARATSQSQNRQQVMASNTPQPTPTWALVVVWLTAFWGLFPCLTESHPTREQIGTRPRTWRDAVPTPGLYL